MTVLILYVFHGGGRGVHGQLFHLLFIRLITSSRCRLSYIITNAEYKRVCDGYNMKDEDILWVSTGQ